MSSSVQTTPTKRLSSPSDITSESTPISKRARAACAPLSTTPGDVPDSPGGSQSDGGTPTFQQRRKRVHPEFESSSSSSSFGCSTPVISTGSPVFRPKSAHMGRRSRSASVESIDDSISDMTMECVAWADESAESELNLSMNSIRINNRGKDFNLFEPQDPNSFYFMLVHMPTEMERHISQWITRYQNGEQLDTICEILQLFCDLMGYQIVQVKDFYTELNETNFKKPRHPVVEAIDEAEIEIQIPQYLFACLFHWSKSVRNAFYVFLDKFMTMCYSANVLYPITIQLSYFFMHAVKTDLRSVMHTCCVILTKIINTFLDLLNAIIVKEGPNSDNKMETWLKRMISFHLTMIDLKGEHSDRQLLGMRLELADAIKHWIKNSPQYILREEKIYLLLEKLLLDKDPNIRLATMRCCMIIVSKNVDKEYIQKTVFDHLLSVIINRVEDVDLTVASLAIQFHTKTLERFPGLFTQFRIDSKTITYCMLSSYSVIRKQALLNFCTSVRMLGLTGVQFLHRIAETIETLTEKEKISFVVYLVEAVSSEVHEISNLNLILCAMESDLHKETYKYYLLQIFCYSARLQYLGQLDTPNATKNDKPQQSDKQKICIQVLECILGFLETFGEKHSKCIFQTLSMFSINELQKPECAEHISQLPDRLIKYFEKYSDEGILSEITKFFAYCCTADGFVKRYFSIKVAELCKFGAEFPRKFVSIIEEDTNLSKLSNQYAHNVKLLVKLKCLIKHFNLNKYSNIDWNDIVQDWNTPGAIHKISRLKMQCCLHFTLWHLKEIIENDMNTTDMQITYAQTIVCDYKEDLITIISNNEAHHTVIHTAFECICTLFPVFANVINEAPEPFREDANRMALHKLDTIDSDIVCNFAVKMLKMELSEMRPTEVSQNLQYLSWILTMFMCGTIDLIHSYRILSFYNSEMKSDYGDLLTPFFDCITDSTRLSELLLYVLKQLYYIELEATVEESLRAIKHLNSVMNQFLKYLSKRNISCQVMVNVAIIIVHNNLEMSGFLLRIQPMLSTLKPQEVQSIKLLFEERFKEYEDHNLKKFKLYLDSFCRNTEGGK